jgi:hypothetical protein
VRLHGAEGARTEHKGVAWIVGAFLICPCHLPLTLWLAAALLSGTRWGPLLLGHKHAVGTAITLVWLVATAYGIHQILAAGRTRAEDESCRSRFLQGRGQT